MSTKSKSIALLICSFASVLLTLIAPLAEQVTEGFFNTYEEKVSLFSGLNVPIVSILVTLVGVGLLCVVISSFFTDQTKMVVKWTIALSSLFLILQIVAIVIAMNYYNDSSLWSALKSEAGTMSISVTAILACIFSISAIILAGLGGNTKKE